LYLHQQALDTSTPSGRAMFQMCGVFAEFERGMIRERVNAGLARAKAAAPNSGGVQSRLRSNSAFESFVPKGWVSSRLEKLWVLVRRSFSEF
jgi:DNA invertase Pin-like site-specific DNA recombinase